MWKWKGINMINRLNEIEAVIFDFDGTLVDSMGIWGEIDVEYLGKYGLQVPNGLQEKIEGMSFTETAEYFKQNFAIPDSIEEIKEQWNKMAGFKYTHEIALKKGAREFLDFCYQKGLKIGIASSNSMDLVVSAMKALDIYHYFDIVCTSCDVGKGKPAPDVYLKAADDLQVAPSHCMVFEDIIPGIQAGKAAGMTVCAIEDTYSSKQKEQKKELADYFIEDYLELVA